MKLKRKLTLDEFELGILLTDPFLFTCHFWKDDLTVPKDRTDLPRRYRGRQIITLEQRVMMMDGAVAMLFYDTMPEEARKSSRSVMVRSSRKIGKTIVYESKYIQIAITNTRRGNTEGLMHAPGEVHLAPVLARIYSKIARTPLFKLLHLSTDRSSGIDRWKTGYTWHTRIEGTCLHGDSMIVAYDGDVQRMMEICEAVGNDVSVLTVDTETFSSMRSAQTSAVCTGKQDVFEVMLSDGWSLKATANHPLLTPDGWRRVDELVPGDYVAVVKSLPEPSGNKRLSKEEARLLGYFIGDGNTTNGCPRFTAFDGDVMRDFTLCCSIFPDVSIRHDRNGQVSLTCGNRGGLPNPLSEFLREHGVFEKYAHEKTVPPIIFEADNETVAQFLSGLFATDGSVTSSRDSSGPRYSVSYSSVSRKLIDGILHLLLRFGIRMRIKGISAGLRKLPGGVMRDCRQAWEIATCEAEDIIRLSRILSIPGAKGAKLQKAASDYAHKAKAYRIDSIPNQIVRKAILDAGVTQAEIARALGYRMRRDPRRPNVKTLHTTKTFFHYRSLSLDLVRRIAGVIKSPMLDNLVNGHVGWRKIKSITSAGIVTTFDLTVPDTHSFIANGFIVHNSGTGRNMVGLRAQHDIGDECDYGSEEAYNERMQTDLPSCFRYWGGVPRGVRGIAWRIAKTGEGANWSRHYNGKYARLRFDMRANILYHSKEAWNDQLRGAGYTDQRVRTQVLGLDGDVAISSFPVIPVNKDLPFLRGDIVGFDIEDDVRLDARTKVPWDKVGHYDRALLYGDYGYSPSPFILGIAYEKDGVWYQLARFRVIRAHAQNAAKLVAHLDRLAPRPFDLIVIDAHGRGAGVMETIHYDPRWESHNFRARAIDAGFGGSVQDKNRMIHKACRNLVRFHQTLGWLCDACGRVIYDESDLRPAMIPTKQVATVWLKEALAEGQQYLDTGELPYKIALVMANDEESILELSGTTEIEAESGVVRYITENGAEPHITDHWRAWAVGANRLIDMARGLLDEDVDQFGWVSIPQGRSDELVVAAMPDF